MKMVFKRTCLPARPPVLFTIIAAMALEVWDLPMLAIVAGSTVVFMLWFNFVVRRMTEKEVDIFDDYLERQERLVKQVQEQRQ